MWPRSKIFIQKAEEGLLFGWGEIGHHPWRSSSRQIGGIVFCLRWCARSFDRSTPSSKSADDDRLISEDEGVCSVGGADANRCQVKVSKMVLVGQMNRRAQGREERARIFVSRAF